MCNHLNEHNKAYFHMSDATKSKNLLGRFPIEIETQISNLALLGFNFDRKTSYHAVNLILHRY